MTSTEILGEVALAACGYLTVTASASFDISKPPQRPYDLLRRYSGHHVVRGRLAASPPKSSKSSETEGERAYRRQLGGIQLLSGTISFVGSLSDGIDFGILVCFVLPRLSPPLSKRLLGSGMLHAATYPIFRPSIIRSLVSQPDFAIHSHLPRPSATS